jgi:hypothetical protein
MTGNLFTLKTIPVAYLLFYRAVILRSDVTNVFWTYHVENMTLNSKILLETYFLLTVFNFCGLFFKMPEVVNATQPLIDVALVKLKRNNSVNYVSHLNTIL